jgi:hypothetical protein
MQRIKELESEIAAREREISALRSELWKERENLFSLYTQDTYLMYLLRRTKYDDEMYRPKDWVLSASDVKTTDTVSVETPSIDAQMEGSTYASLYSNSLIDLIEHCGKHGCIIYRINGCYDNVNAVASFIRRNLKAIREHRDSLKLQQLLYTCDRTNLELVKLLLKG